MKNSLLVLLISLCFIDACNEHKIPSVTTFAGTGAMGALNGKGTTATFSYMMGVTVDASGNVYVADSHNNLIRKITADGMVTTLAGNGQAGCKDGSGDSASFFNPAGLSVDKKGNVYVADTHNSLIRKISPEGIVTTIAGIKPSGLRAGPYDSVKLDNPQGIAVDSSGNVYVADWAKDLIRKISPEGKVTNIAGNGNPGAADGAGPASSFYLPEGIAVDAAGNLFIADTYNNMIRKISTAGIVTTIAGKKTKGSADGKGTSASFFHPAGINVDKDGNLFIADAGNNKIRKISPEGIVTTFAGTGQRGSNNGPVADASFYRPFGVAVGKEGEVYVADYQNNLIRKIVY
jgi:serine/threonine-protein kinase